MSIGTLLRISQASITSIIYLFPPAGFGTLLPVMNLMGYSMRTWVQKHYVKNAIISFFRYSMFTLKSYFYLSPLIFDIDVIHFVATKLLYD